MTLTEVEPSPVHHARPLLGGEPGTRMDLDFGIGGQPLAHQVLVHLFLRGDRPALGRRPELLRFLLPCRPVALALLRRLAARAGEAIVMEVGGGEARVAGAQARVAPLDVAPLRESAERLGRSFDIGKGGDQVRGVPPAAPSWRSRVTTATVGRPELQIRGGRPVQPVRAASATNDGFSTT